MKINLFDIETGSMPASELCELMPEFSAPKNYKDPEAIKASIDKQRQEWIQDAALSPITGQVLVIGIMGQDGALTLLEGEEGPLLTRWWEWVKSVVWVNDRIFGWSIHHFDLPFLIKRSWKHNIDVPAIVRTSDLRYWSENFVDLQAYWRLGDIKCESSLDTVARFLGLGAKTSDGSQFAALWKADKSKAIEYLKNDLALTKAIWERTLLAL